MKTQQKDRPRSTLDRARSTVRRQLDAGKSVSEIEAYLVSYYGSNLPSVAIMAYDGHNKVDGILHVAARHWVRDCTTIAKER